MNTLDILKLAKSAKTEIGILDDTKINLALNFMADSLVENQQDIVKANEKDVFNAKDKISSVMIDRLTLTPERISSMASGIREITKLPTPLGLVLDTVNRPNGLNIQKVSVPFGVIAIIYESRPNVTSDAAALCIKSGNACVLRGGKEAFNSSLAIVNALKKGLKKAGVCENAINLVLDTSRESASELMHANGYVDLLIPRGGKGLIKACIENATVPCLETGTGICHVFVDESADIDMALSIIENAKTSRPSVCNAMEVLLVHSGIADKLLPLLSNKLKDERIKKGLTPVEFKLCDRAKLIINGTPATTDDFDTEFLDYKMAIKIVDSVDEAILHIEAHSTHHSEAIISSNNENIDKFTRLVDSSSVYVNASTRFTDGGEFGLGCEMGISTQKMHARGPLGIKELTTYKYIIKGNGQIR